MEEEKKEESQKMNSKYLNTKLLLIFIIIFLAGGVLGFLSNPIIQKQNSKLPENITKIPQIKNTDPRFLVDPIEVLKSPIFTEWHGSVEGKVVETSEKSFTIEKAGRRLTLTLQEGLSLFFKENAGTADRPNKVEFDQIRVGDYVRGGATVTRGVLDNQTGSHVYANVFTVINENPTTQ